MFGNCAEYTSRVHIHASCRDNRLDKNQDLNSTRLEKYNVKNNLHASEEVCLRTLGRKTIKEIFRTKKMQVGIYGSLTNQRQGHIKSYEDIEIDEILKVIMILNPFYDPKI